jgi:hypothetical protein
MGHKDSFFIEIIFYTINMSHRQGGVQATELERTPAERLDASRW